MRTRPRRSPTNQSSHSSCLDVVDGVAAAAVVVDAVEVVAAAVVDGAAGAGESNSYCPRFATGLGPETKDKSKGLGFDEEGCAHCHPRN